MERLRQWVRNWLGFSRTEVNGFLILLPLMVALIVSEPLYRLYLGSRPRDFSAEEKVLDSLVSLWNTSEEKSTAADPPSKIKTVPLTYFDPNKSSVAELQRLGFPENLSKRIANYRQKGGVFRIKSDLLKMYGMDSTYYTQLHPYILLPERREVKEKTRKVDVVQQTITVEEFDLNKADTAMLKNVYGIGSARAARIIKFRTKLGGFVNEDQLFEVFGLDSAIVQELKEKSFIASDFVPDRIDLNESDEKSLSSHPYIGKPLAKAIIAFRYQHGKFNDVIDIKMISILNNRDAEKLLPYLKVKE